MFVTVSESQVHVPTKPTARTAARWRAVELEGHGFFMAAMTIRGDEPGFRRTVLVVWDSDLVHFIESPKMAATLHSLRYVVSTHGSPAGVMQVRDIREVWRGLDKAAHDAEVIIFKTEDGARFCGPDQIPVPASVVETVLLARVED